MDKLKIVAEIGLNHNGNFNLAMEMIRQVALNGADLIKFQIFDVDELFGEDHPNYEHLKKCCLSYKEYFDLAMECAVNNNVAPFFSIFDNFGFKFLNYCLGRGLHLGSFVKFASRVVSNNPEFINNFNYEEYNGVATQVYLSHGMCCTGGKLKRHRRIKVPHKKKDFKHVYCVAKYPTEDKDIHMPKHFGGKGEFYGYSDHTLGIRQCMLAISRGAKYIEKHFTLNKTMEGTDHICSMDSSELSELVRFGKLFLNFKV